MKLNQYPTDDTAADVNIFNFWQTAGSAVKKTTWGNLKALLLTAFSATIAELIAGVSTVKYATVALLFDKIILTYDASKAYPVGVKLLYTDWNLYKVITATTAGQTPDSNPAKFQLLGSASGVSSFEGRSGVVTTQNGDYQTDEITEAGDKLFVSAAEKGTWNGKQDALGFTPVPITRTINGQALNADIIIAGPTSAGAGAPVPDSYIEFVVGGITFRVSAQNMTP